MNFGERFKKIRTERNLTQEDVALRLNVSRQAVSHWENNKNLPDLEMLIKISEIFDVSLDQLILGSNGMNNLAEKLIRDGNETRRTRSNLISFSIGAVLLLIGTGCLLIKAGSVEYIDAAGVLHESFFLIPVSLLFMFCGLIAFSVAGIKSLLSKRRQPERTREKERP